MNHIEQLKILLPAIPSLVDLKTESQGSLCGPCPKCGGTDRFVYKTDTECFWCRQCRPAETIPPGDIIDFHKWLKGVTTSDLLKQYFPEDKQANQWQNILSQYPNKDPVYRLFTNRKIGETVIDKAFTEEKVCFSKHREKDCVACAFTSLNGNKNVLTVQHLTVDGSNFPSIDENKVFRKGDRAGGDCFFQAGADIETANTIILSEAVINALSCADCIPEACILAIGGSTFTNKVKVLRQYRDAGKKVVCFFDNDDAGRNATQKVATLLGVKTLSVAWPGNASDGFDANDLLKNDDRGTIVEMVRNAKPIEIKNKAKSQKKKIVVIDKFSPRPWALELCEKYQLRFDLQKRLWIYDSKSGLWSENAEAIIEVELRKNLLGAELLKKYYITEIIADVRSLVFTQDEKHEPPLELIPFNNIIYNLKTDEQLKYDPKYFFTSKLAVNFNPNATCPFIDKIFSQLVYDPIDLYELNSYCFYRGYVFAKWFFLWGSGGNGKTVFTTILERLIGKHNIRSITAEQLMDNRFAVADLHSKFANLAGEMSYNTLEKTAILKQLVGGDLLRGERKYREPFYFNNFAKLIFNTNSLPKTNDKTRAFYRRLYLIEFPNRFEGSDKEDKLLFQKITQEEIEGLAIKCLGYLMDLFDRGFFFTNDQSVDDLTKKYERLTNPLITFLDETTQRDLNDAIPKWQLRDLFTQWLSDKSFRIWNATQISKEMKLLGYDDGRHSFDGSTQRCFFGLKWKE